MFLIKKLGLFYLLIMHILHIKMFFKQIPADSQLKYLNVLNIIDAYALGKIFVNIDYGLFDSFI